MKYKGYTGIVTFEEDDKIFHGEVIDTKDVITFQGKSVDEVEKAFHESIDDYIEFCKERGKEPNKPFSGKFVLRISPKLHRQIYLNAAKEGKSLNVWLLEKIENSCSCNF